MTWLFAVVENIRLRKENDELRDEIDILRKQLMEEIDSNREREAEAYALLASTIVPNVDVKAVSSRRSMLSRPPSKQERVPELDFTAEPTDDINDADVIQRAHEFIVEAARHGREYDFDVVCKRIRENPQEYLTN